MENVSREELELSHLENELLKFKKQAKSWRSNFILDICGWIITSIWAAFNPSVLWLVFLTGSLMILSIVLWIVYTNKTRAKQVEIENKKDFIALSKKNIPYAKPNAFPEVVPQAQAPYKAPTVPDEQIDIKAKILKLNTLLEEGLITREEYETSKKELLKRI